MDFLGEPAPRGSAASREQFITYLSGLSRPKLWRVRSRVCAAVDIITVAVGGGIIALTAVDVLSTWHTSRALVDHQHLSMIMGASLGPCWIWLFISMVMTVPHWNPNAGWPRHREPLRVAENRRSRAEAKTVMRNMYPGRRVPWILLAVGACCICVVTAGFAMGAVKGSGYILPGPRYEITTMGLNDDTVTSVSADQYAYWQAQFVRYDSMFTIFGLFLVAGGLGLIQLHRTATAK